MRWSLMCSFLFLAIVQSAFALEECGEAKIEKRHDKHFFTHLSYLNIDSPVAKVKGVLCAGILKGESKRIDLLIFRDQSGDSQELKMSYLKEKTRVLYKNTNIPLIRRGSIFGLHVIEEKVKLGKTSYKIAIKFLRNLSPAFWRPKDFRVFLLSVSKKHDSDVVLSHRYSNERSSFNNVDLDLNVGLVVKTIELKDFDSTKELIQTSSLRKIQSF